MMKNAQPEKDWEIEDKITKNIRNLCRLEKENETIKDRVIRGIKNLFDHQEEVFYRPVTKVNFWSNNYIEHVSNGDRNQTLSISNIREFLKDIINDLKKSDTRKIQQRIYDLSFVTSF